MRTTAVARPPAGHPLYDDDTLVHHVTQRHLDQGRTIFQLWLAGPTEREHATTMLDLVRPPHRARVLSLGCGVGGMERWWHTIRPDMTFTLQNISQAQLDLCLCPGERVLGDAQAYALDRHAMKHDLTVLAYMLGHVDVETTLRHAIAATCGTIFVLDVMEVDDAFKRLLCYDPPSPWTMTKLGFHRLHRSKPAWYRVPMGKPGELDGTEEQIDAVGRSQPVIWARYG